MSVMTPPALSAASAGCGLHGPHHFLSSQLFHAYSCTQSQIAQKHMRHPSGCWHVSKLHRAGRRDGMQTMDMAKWGGV